MIASHYDGFAQGIAGKLDSMLIPAFSMLIKQGTACAVEGDMKVAMAMSILKAHFRYRPAFGDVFHRL